MIAINFLWQLLIIIIFIISVPPGVPIIKDYNGKVLSGVIGPYNEGDSLHLICQAEGGKMNYFHQVSIFNQYYKLGKLKKYSC